MRGGYGIFYDRTPTNTLIAASSNPPFAGIANIFDGNIDNPGGGTARSFPPNMTVFPRQLKTPSIMSLMRQRAALRNSADGTLGASMRSN